ncbi:chromobox protein homolog 3 isoform X1 [Rhizophagus irregularis DAOM 181602=DAOM 197198]|nr:chromobox protein homolog 3 isoform X1 [Rhizophagus irregularis DAOM 181602=DAOM 197198]
MSHLENYYKYYNLSRVPARILKGEEHYNLYKKPLKEKSSERPRVVVWKPNATHQADLAEMPVDPKGFHYFLVVVEVAEDFRDVVNKIDEIWQRNPPDIPTGSPKVSKKTELLSEGTHVRVKLDEPISVLGNKLHGKFRTGDIRWNPNIRVIKKMILSPEQPPTYLLDGPHGRLGVSKCAGQPERFVPERILRHRIRKGQDQYLVKWERYPDTEATWEPADRLEEDVPALIRKFWE